MNGITFTKKTGGLGRPLDGSAHISALIVYGETAVSKVLVLSVDELEGLGISPTSHPITHYHISEFFRVNPGSKLYLEVVASSDGTYTELKVLQNFANGDIRQCAVCDFDSAISTLSTRLATLNAIGQSLFEAKTPLQILLSMKVVSADMATLIDLHSQNSNYVSVVLGQDGAGRGAYLAETLGSVSAIGAVLGAVSRADIHESIAWVERQNMVSTAYPKTLTNDVEKGKECDVLAFADGSLLGDYTPQQIQSIHDKGYVFFVKHSGVSGSYINDSFTATSEADDYAYIENNRVIGECVRELQRVFIPKISGPIYVDPTTGELTESNASVLESFADNVIAGFKSAGQISGGAVSIPVGQQPVRDSKLDMVLTIVPVGTLREININLGLSLQL